MNSILFTPMFSIGDIVCLKIAPENKMVIDGYNIKQVSEAGEVTFFRYSMYDNEGTTYSYSEHDLELVEAIRSK